MIRVVLGLIFISLISLGCDESKAKEIQVVTVEEMNTEIRYNTKDKEIKSKDDFKKSHLVNAESIIENKDLRLDLNKLDKNSPIAIYFVTKIKSNEAALVLQDLGFQQIYILDGGIKKWQFEEASYK